MIDPRGGISLQNWTDSFQIDFPADNVPPIDGEDWRVWGERLLESPTFANQDIDKPDSYTDWRAWAARVYQALG